MPFITQGKSNWIYIMIVFIVAALTVCGILIYIENYNNELYLLNQSVGMKNPEKNQGEFANWNVYNNGEISFKYPSDVWQLGNKDFISVTNIKIKNDNSLINKKIDNCESWLGIDSANGKCKNPVFTIGSGCSTDNVIECETPKTEDVKKINLDDGASAERTTWTAYSEKKIENWYDIYNQKSNEIYCAALFTYPENQEQCLNNFEQVLSTFKFISTSTDETATKSGVEKEEETLRNRCSGENETVCGPLGCTSGCCPGLVLGGLIWPARSKNNEVVCDGDEIVYICVKCGDGICGTKENWCNCPEDCTKPNPANLNPSLFQ